MKVISAVVAVIAIVFGIVAFFCFSEGFFAAGLISLVATMGLSGFSILFFFNKDSHITGIG